MPQHVGVIFKLPRDDMDHIAVGIALDDSVDCHQPRAHDDLALLVEHIGPDDEIGDPRLVLQRDEADALGAARSLPDQHQPSHRQPLPIADGAQPVGGDELQPRIMFAQEPHRVRLQRQARGLVIVHHMLGQRHGRKLSRHLLRPFVASVRMREQGQVGRLLQGARIP